MEIRIGELAKLPGCEVVTIRYYEKQALLPDPARRDYAVEYGERLSFTRHRCVLALFP